MTHALPFLLLLSLPAASRFRYAIGRGMADRLKGNRKWRREFGRRLNAIRRIAEGDFMTSRTPDLRVFEDTSRMSAGLSVTEYMLGSIATSLKRLADAAVLPARAAGEAMPLDDHVVGRFAKAIMHGSIEHRRWLAAAARQFIAKGMVEKSTAEHDEYERGRRDEREAWINSLSERAKILREHGSTEAAVHLELEVRQRTEREG